MVIGRMDKKGDRTEPVKKVRNDSGLNKAEQWKAKRF